MTKSSLPDSNAQTMIMKTSRNSFCPNRYQRYTRHGQRLRYLRRFMPLAAGFAVIMIFLWPELMIHFDRHLSHSSPFDQKVRVQNQLNNPRFQSTDAHHRFYEIGALKAIQKSKDEMVLEIPQSSLELDDGNVMKISAKSGFYDVKSKNLDYQENVILTTTQGYRLQTSQAHLDMKGKQASGSQVVEGQGPIGSFKASRFKATADGKIHLEGRSHLTITKTSPQNSMVSQP